MIGRPMRERLQLSVGPLRISVVRPGRHGEILSWTAVTKVPCLTREEHRSDTYLQV